MDSVNDSPFDFWAFREFPDHPNPLFKVSFLSPLNIWVFVPKVLPLFHGFSLRTHEHQKLTHKSCPHETGLAKFGVLWDSQVHA